jgi:hypothetical protein
MNRNEMLAILQNLKLSVVLTGLTTEGALDCLYITSKGYFHEWRELYDWPYYKFNRIDHDKLIGIREKVRQQTLTYKDLEDTVLKKLYISEMGEDLNAVNMFFENIDDLSLCDEDSFYVSVENSVAYFFKTYGAFEKAFEERLTLCVHWEDMSDDELAEYVEEITSENQTFTFCEESESM